MFAEDEKILSLPVARPIATSTILVADDDPDLLVLMARRLTKGGYVVVTAANGQQALELAVRQMPDLALLDVMMPELTGLEVAARLRAEPSTRAIRIILVSAGFSAADGRSVDEPAADGFIVKPFDRSEPVNEVGNVLAGRSTRSPNSGFAFPEPPEALRDASTDPPVTIGDRT